MPPSDRTTLAYVGLHASQWLLTDFRHKHICYITVIPSHLLVLSNGEADQLDQFNGITKCIAKFIVRL